MSKMLRVSDEVADKINSMKSSGMSVSSFIEELLNRETPAGAVKTEGSDKRIDEILLIVRGMTSEKGTTPEKKSVATPLSNEGSPSGMVKIRTPSVIDQEIKEVEAERDDKIDNCQDDEENAGTYNEYQAQIITLQAEKNEYFNKMRS